jgi:hypothetical protein
MTKTTFAEGAERTFTSRRRRGYLQSRGFTISP